MPECSHRVGSDPRYQDSCQKCGKLLEIQGLQRRLPDVGPPKVFAPDLPQENFGKDPTRDLDLERRFLADALELAQRSTGITNHAYPGRVNHRLQVGRERYGDGDFLTKDCITEVLEETPDLAAYAMLEYQRLVRVGGHGDLAGVRLDLVACAAYGAVADFYAQRAGRRLKGQPV